FLVLRQPSRGGRSLAANGISSTMNARAFPFPGTDAILYLRSHCVSARAANGDRSRSGARAVPARSGFGYARPFELSHTLNNTLPPGTIDSEVWSRIMDHQQATNLG